MFSGRLNGMLDEEMFKHYLKGIISEKAIPHIIEIVKEAEAFLKNC